MIINIRDNYTSSKPVSTHPDEDGHVELEGSSGHIHTNVFLTSKQNNLRPDDRFFTSALEPLFWKGDISIKFFTFKGKCLISEQSFESSGISLSVSDSSSEPHVERRPSNLVSHGLQKASGSWFQL